MSAQSSYKPSDMVQSMKVKVSTFTQQFSQTEINNLHLGKNNQVRLTNQAMINHIRNSNLSSLTPSIEITPKYTTLNQQSSGDDDGITQINNYTYTYGTGSYVLIDPGNGNNLQNNYPNNSQNNYNYLIYSPMYYPNNSPNNSPVAYIYMGGMYATWSDIVNNILTNSFITVNSNSFINSNTAPSSQLTTNNSWLPNQSGNGSSYWYNCSLWYEDYVAQQIIVYAALYAYISTKILMQPINAQMSLALITNATGPMYIPPSASPAAPPPGPPYNVGNIVFSTAWPFQLNSLSIQTYYQTYYGDEYPPSTYTIPYDPNGFQLPTGLSGLTTLDENDMLNIFKINMPIALGGPSGSVVNTYSSNPTNIVSLTPAGQNSAGQNSVIVMNFTGPGTATGTTTVTISSSGNATPYAPPIITNVSFNVNISSSPINLSS